MELCRKYLRDNSVETEVKSVWYCVVEEAKRSTLGQLKGEWAVSCFQVRPMYKKSQFTICQVPDVRAFYKRYLYNSRRVANTRRYDEEGLVNIYKRDPQGFEREYLQNKYLPVNWVICKKKIAVLKTNSFALDTILRHKSRRLVPSQVLGRRNPRFGH